MRIVIMILAVLVLLPSCMKEELPAPRAPRGDARSTQLCMGTGYANQLWFDLSSGSVVSENVRTTWDLAFESAPAGWRVLLNGSRLMTVWPLGAVDIAQPHDTAGLGASRRVDAASLHPDSLAFGDWRGTNGVFIVDLGLAPDGTHMGLRKLRFSNHGPDGYSITHAMLDGSAVMSTVVPKDPQRSFTSWSFAQGVLPIEPIMGEWDLCFTQFTHRFEEFSLDYLVNGVLGATTTRIARITGLDFTAITAADTLSFPFRSERNAIGY
ncbi:MAG TPA: HmuY family protein, partial [Flavobacteriales bacterium]|nr:HmuY family protein [Flavobacteriales bacterium]